MTQKKNLNIAIATISDSRTLANDKSGDILENNYTNEEMKMSFETNKILSKDIKLSASCVRVPVLYGHSLAVHVETKKEIELDLLISQIKNQKGLDYFDPKDFISPNVVDHAEGKNPVSVGRLRLDLWNSNRVNFWVVADNLRKGAALNSLQILDELQKLFLYSHSYS